MAIHDVVRSAFGRATEAVLVDQLRADGDSVVSSVAVDHAGIVGHVMLSAMKAPFKALGLGPLSVRPNRQRSDVGSSLVREGLIRAQQGGWDAVFVLGDPRFYGRFGFDPVLRLPLVAGKIDYASAFVTLGDNPPKCSTMFTHRS